MSKSSIGFLISKTLQEIHPLNKGQKRISSKNIKKRFREIQTQLQQMNWRIGHQYNLRSTILFDFVAKQ